ncbi:response regulator [Halobacteriovorax sp. GB3]|uniref:response regulator n=1 Tax=Halobacteriovorax sp. GB3 TaxID=2719615 RepID=UPI0023603C63|nr:response regulator [Halobacteriovorax sp. GB3]MDD0852406.1 response regulator [Halobacteriovorax sp. GB3]
MNILVVDDEKMLVESIADTLSAYDAIRNVIKAYDGAQALQKLSNQKFDIIILDIDMPRKSGLEILKFIRDDDLNSSAFVLMISGNFTPDYIKEATQSTKYFLAKPFKVNNLKEKLGQILLEKKKQASVA